MTAPDQMRQRLVADALAAAEVGEEAWKIIKPLCDQIEADGRRLARICELVEEQKPIATSASYSRGWALIAILGIAKGNEKGDGGRDAPGTASRADEKSLSAATTATTKDGPATPSRPQEQPRKATGDEMVEAARGAIERALAECAVAEFGPRSKDFPYADAVAELRRRAALAAAALALLPELSVSPAAAQGWQMVPVKPTPEMLDVIDGPLRTAYPRDALRRRWSLMLAAAPPSPAAQEQEKGEQT